SIEHPLPPLEPMHILGGVGPEFFGVTKGLCESLIVSVGHVGLVRSPHPALRATLSRGERAIAIESLLPREKVAEGRMRGSVLRGSRPGFLRFFPNLRAMAFTQRK